MTLFSNAAVEASEANQSLIVHVQSMESSSLNHTRMVLLSSDDDWDDEVFDDDFDDEAEEVFEDEWEDEEEEDWEDTQDEWSL